MYMCAEALTWVETVLPGWIAQVPQGRLQHEVAFRTCSGIVKVSLYLGTVHGPMGRTQSTGSKSICHDVLTQCSGFCC